MKLFEVCESETGYIVGFKVYTGKDAAGEGSSVVFWIQDVQK